ncbi:MAG: fibronectin type III-like domain-contianing protein, partial [Muribaculaceae bacterium]|nr:fibronectin type III-like domain-contianing protein [Muribaculaceae bacterium]
GTSDDVFTITVPVTNVGKVKGKEVVQLYVNDVKSSVDRPVKELKGFSKVELAPGETEQVSITVKGSDLGYFDADKHQWVVEPGVFEALVGSSSADIHTKAKFTIK